MSTINDFAFGVSNPSVAGFIQTQYPGIIYSGTEANGGTCQQVEVSGAWWTVFNATYSQLFGGFVQTNPSAGSYGYVLLSTGVLSAVSAAAGATAPIVWTFTDIGAGSGGGGGQMNWGPVTIGGGNVINNIVSRYLSYSPVIIAGAIVFSTGSNPNTYFNIVLGEGTPNGVTPATGASAVAGNQVFSSNQLLPAAGVTATFTAPTLAFWSGDVTLRVITPAGSGISGLQVAAALVGAT